ncbi:filaggrin-2-like isoform X2 [Lethenteron reissneri]|uniref:filaggrin-2-like isoform X2 n=1 Tax=Lethenteron reissneri TaxID=7753 RepID=UPI002AB5F7D3|nr:filaggrin-2-like isoform X2 [Lethenteron reissneri]
MMMLLMMMFWTHAVKAFLVEASSSASSSAAAASSSSAASSSAASLLHHHSLCGCLLDRVRLATKRVLTSPHASGLPWLLLLLLLLLALRFLGSRLWRQRERIGPTVLIGGAGEDQQTTDLCAPTRRSDAAPRPVAGKPSAPSADREEAGRPGSGAPGPGTAKPEAAKRRADGPRQQRPLLAALTWWTLGARREVAGLRARLVELESNWGRPLEEGRERSDSTMPPSARCARPRPLLHEATEPRWPRSLELRVERLEAERGEPRGHGWGPPSGGRGGGGGGGAADGGPGGGGQVRLQRRHGEVTEEPRLRRSDTEDEDECRESDSEVESGHGEGVMGHCGVLSPRVPSSDGREVKDEHVRGESDSRSNLTKVTEAFGDPSPSVGSIHGKELREESVQTGSMVSTSHEEVTDRCCLRISLGVVTGECHGADSVVVSSCGQVAEELTVTMGSHGKDMREGTEAGSRGGHVGVTEVCAETGSRSRSDLNDVTDQTHLRSSLVEVTKVCTEPGFRSGHIEVNQVCTQTELRSRSCLNEVTDQCHLRSSHVEVTKVCTEPGSRSKSGHVEVTEVYTEPGSRSKSGHVEVTEVCTEPGSRFRSGREEATNQYQGRSGDRREAAETRGTRPQVGHTPCPVSRSSHGETRTEHGAPDSTFRSGHAGNVEEEREEGRQALSLRQDSSKKIPEQRLHVPSPLSREGHGRGRGEHGEPDSMLRCGHTEGREVRGCSESDGRGGHEEVTNQCRWPNADFRSGPGEIREEFGASESRLRCGPGEIREEFVASESRLRCGPGEIREEFGASESRLRCSPAEIREEFGASESRLRCGPREIREEFGASESRLRCGPGEIREEFGASESRLRCGPGEVREEFGASESRLRYGPGEIREEFVASESRVRSRHGEDATSNDRYLGEAREVRGCPESEWRRGDDGEASDDCHWPDADPRPQGPGRRSAAAAEERCRGEGRRMATDIRCTNASGGGGRRSAPCDVVECDSVCSYSSGSKCGSRGGRGVDDDEDEGDDGDEEDLEGMGWSEEAWKSYRTAQKLLESNYSSNRVRWADEEEDEEEGRDDYFYDHKRSAAFSTTR